MQIPSAIPASLSNSAVLVVGDSMLDRYWFGDVERISPEAPVPIVKIAREEHRLGGAANVALNVRALGTKAALMTVVGHDEPATRLEQLLAASGIVSFLGHDAQLHTIVKLRVIGRSQQLLRIDFENEPDHEILASLLEQYRDVMPSYNAVLFSDYGKGGLTHIPEMIRTARAAGKAVLIDPKGRDYQRYYGASVITPNKNELLQVVGPWGSEDELRRKAQTLRQELGLEALLLTRSEEGMTLFDHQGHMDVPTQARDVYDITGAGDTVIATMAALLACGLTVREAVPIANKAAGIVVGKFGTAHVGAEELFG